MNSSAVIMRQANSNALLHAHVCNRAHWILRRTVAMKIFSTILTAAVMLQFSCCAQFAAAADATMAANSNDQSVEVADAGCGVKKRHHSAQQMRTTTSTSTSTST